MFNYFLLLLSRFYFEGQQSAKVTTPISFLLEKFNLDFVCSAEALSKEHCVYDLIGLVCHTGGTSIIYLFPQLLLFYHFDWQTNFS